MRKTLRFSIAQTALPLLFTCLITSLSAQTVYLHNFGTTTISTHPYTVAPGIFDTNLSGSSWSNSTGVWTNLAGASGQAIAIPSASNESSATLTFNVNGGYALSISQYRFYIRRATTAPTTWTMTINGNPVGSGTILTAGATTGFISTSVTGLTGIVAVVLTFSGGSGSGSIRIDDFRLDGSNCTAPTIALGTNPSVCQGTTSANLPYSATTGSPDQYKIDYNAAAESAGFVDVSYTALPATPITLVVPGAAPGAVYNATLKVRKAATPGCESASMPFTVTVSAPPAPVVTSSPAASVCTGTNVTLSTTAFSSYAWSSPPGGATQSVMHTPVSNTTYTVTVTNATGCSGTGSVTVSVVSQPSITLGTSPAVCQGVTTANLSYSGTTGSPNEYTIDYDATANSNGFVDVTYTSLPASPIGLVVPGAAPAATYNATIKVRSGAGCESNAVPFTVTVRSLPSATITGAMTACSNTGGNTASTTAGLSTYTWSISNGTITAGGTTNSITYTAGTSGTVTLNVTVTDANGCMASSSKMVVINALPMAMISATSPICANTTGNTATASGGTGYSWGITNGTITSGAGISTVTYTAGASGTTTLSVTVTDANGCTATASQAVTLTPAPSAAITATPSAVCANSTGNTAAVGNAGMGATYAWSITGGTITAGAGTNSITYTAGASGTVNLSVQISSGSCMVTGSLSVTINPLPSSTITATPTAVCANSTGNTASVPNAGVGATYVWTINNGNITGGAGTRTITYSVTASSPVSLTATVTANGCSTTGSASITVNPLPTITLGTSPAVCRGATSANLPYSATTGSADQYSIDYDVLANTAGFVDVTNATLTASPIALVVPGGASAGLYNATLTVRNSVTGCVSSSTAFTVLLRVQPTITASSNSPVCVGATLNLSSTPASGTPPYTAFAWSGPSYSAGVKDPAGFPASLAAAGTYTVIVTDNNGCTGTGTTVVVVNPLPTITLGTYPAVCRGTNSANLPYTATTGSPNQYSIDYDAAAEAAGFVDVANLTLPATPIALTVPTLAAAAVYNATITVRNSVTGCVSSPVVPFTVVINANPTIAASNTGPVCIGAMVTVSSTPAGGSNVYSTFAWQGVNGFTAAVEDPAAFTTVVASAGAYTVTVTDNNGCSGTGSTTVVLNPLPTIAIGVNPTAIACLGAASANLGYLGTTNSPDQYSIDFDAAAETAGLADVNNAVLPASPIVINTSLVVTAGTYNGTLTVRNSTTGCVSSSTAFTVKINALPSVLILGNAACSNSTGNTASVPSAGMGAIYSWTATNGTITAGAATNSVTYTAGASGTVVFNVTVTDVASCSATGSATVNINPLPSAAITAAPTSVCASSTGNTAFVPVAGGAATYNWTLTDGTITTGQGSTTITYSAAASGTVGMLVTVTDGNGCSATGSGSVVINPAPSAVITTPMTICASANGTASVPDAGMGATYSWSVGNGTGTSVTNTINYTAGNSGTVTLNVTVTYLGCSATGTKSVTINPLPNGSLADASICGVGGVGMLTFTSDAGTGPFQIAYNSGGPTQVAGGVVSETPFVVVPNPASTTIYTITSITDANTCARTGGFTDGVATITVTPLPTASISYAGSPYCSTAGTATATLMGTNAYTGGTYSAPVGLSINSASGEVNIGASTAGTYTVSYTITASGGCPAVTATASITITALPTVSISYNGSPYCSNFDGPATVTRNGTGAFTGGTYTASPAGLAINPSTGLVTLGMSTAGTYTVTYTLVASSGCPAVTASNTITVVEAPVAAINASPSATVCPGEMVTLTATGGDTYLWNTPSTNDAITVSPETTTTYTVTVTKNGCSDTESVEVNVPVVTTLVLDLIADPNPVECGELTTLTVQAMSGFTDITSLQYSVQWDPTKFTFVSAVPVVIGGETPIVFADAMVGNVTYSWGTISVDGDDLAANSPLLNVILKAKASSGSATASITGVPAQIDATNPSFCSMTVTVPASPLSIALSNNPPAPFTASNDGPKCAGLDLGLSSDISGDVTGTDPYTFSWEGPNMFTSSMEDPTVTSAPVAADGIYTVTVTDADGCTATATTTAVVKPAPTVSASNNGPLCAGSTLNLTADQTGGSTFSWKGPNMYTSSVEDPSLPAVTTNAAGIYTVTVTGENACSATASTTVVINESPTFAFTIGGNPVSNINNGTPDPSEMTTVTRCDGGTYAIAGLLQAPANIRYAITVVVTGGVLLFDGGAAGNADIPGAALSGAQGTHTLTLANPAVGGMVVQTLAPYNDVNNNGFYDAGDCLGDPITITYICNPVPNAGTISGTLSVCVGSMTTLTSTGASGGTWSSSNETAATVNSSTGEVLGIAAGTATITYTVTASGCTSSASATVTVNPRPRLEATMNGVTVTETYNGMDDTGTLPSMCNSGTLSFGTFTDLNLAPGTVKVYQAFVQTNVTISICNNCAAPIGLFAGSTAAISLTNPALPGTLELRFRAWVDTNNDGNIDADECAGDWVVYTLTVNPLPNAGTITGTPTVCAGATTTLTSNGAGGGTWTSSSPNATVAGGVVTGVMAGTSTITYTVTASGCMSSTSIVVTVNPAPTAGISGNPTFCAGGSTTLTASGGVSYFWDNESSNPIRTITVAGTYTVIVTGANGCTNSASVTVTLIPAGVTNLTTMETFCRIQDAIDDPQTLPGHIIEAAPGTYYENVLINKQNLTVRSSGGKGVTTIIGTYAGGNNATVAISSGINGVTLQGFTIIGFDGTGGIEAGAVYLIGAHTNITIEGNEIRANGDHGLLCDYNAAISGIVINSNMFTGQTFLGSEPGGCGFTTQFDDGNNVPRQLVTIGGGASVTNSMNVTFTNNMVTGTAGAASTQAGCEANGQGNTLVTIDVLGANISGNLFAGTTARFATSLRARGTATSICNNIFESDGLLGAATAHIFFGTGAPLTGATPNTLAGVASDNAFPDGAYYLTPNHPNSWTIYRDLTQANAVIAANASGQTAVAAATALINPGVISGTTTICVGAMTTLASNGAAGGTWSSSDPMIASVSNAEGSAGKVTGLAGGTVTITYTVTATAGCTSTATTTVTVNPLPVPEITGILSFCTGGNTMLSTGVATSYAWNTLEITQSITVNTAGIYTVTVTNASGCSASASATVTMSPRPALQATINMTTVTDNNNGMDDTGSFTVCNVANNLSFGPFVDLNMTAGNVKVYQTVAYTNAIASFCNNCAAVPAVFTGSGTVSLVNPALPGQLIMSFRAWVDTNNDNVIDAGECAGDWVVYTITINPVPDAGTISGAGPVCLGSTLELSSSGASEGTWSSSDEMVATVSANGVATGVATGTATITYAVTANNCSSSATATVTVNPLPVVTCPENISVCVNAPAFPLEGASPSGAGGTYSGTGVSGGMFTPATAGVGTHTITYSYTDENMCTNTCTFSIIVSTLPVVTCPMDMVLCINEPGFVILGGLPAEGTYSGPGVSSNIFSPLEAGEGMHTITYTYTNGCTNSCTFNIEVKSLPEVTCPENLTVCADATAFALTGGLPSGGVYTGPGVSNGTFTPATAGVGVHTITYKVTGDNSCSNTCTFTVTVNAVPTFAFTAQVGTRPAQTGNNNSGPATVTINFCAGESFTFSGFSAAPDGKVGFITSYTSSSNVTYNGSNIGASGSSPIAPGSAAAFFAATYGPYGLDDDTFGTITQVFTPYNDVNNNGVFDEGIDCQGAPITLQYNIYANPDVIATPTTTTICAGGTTSIALTSSVANTTFTWVVQSTTGTVTGQLPGTGSTIAQTLEGAGTVTYRITPTGPAPNNCPGEYTDVTITVNARPTAVISGSTTICTGNMATLTITLTGAGPWSGSLSNGGPAIPFSGETSPITLSVSTMSTTTYTLSTLLDANCTAIASDLTGSATVTVNNVTAGTIGKDQTVCSNGDPAMLTETMAATGAGTLTYRWESSTEAGCSSGFTTIEEATDATYDPPAGLTTTTYFRRVTISTLNSVSCEAASSCVTVIVNALTPGSIADNQTVCPNGDPAAFTEASSATGTDLTYRWESSTTGCGALDFAPISGATSITYDPPSGLTQTTYYRRVAIATQNNVSCEAVSNCVIVIVQDNTPPTIACPANSTIAADASCTNLLGTWLAVATFDACGTVGVTQTPAANTLLEGHDDFEVVTLTANDGNGNTATCSLTVTLKDATAPAFDCATLTPITVFTDEPSCNSDTDIPVPVAMDNCEGPVSAIGTRSDLVSLNSAWPGSSPTTVTWTFTDPAGNVKTCTQTVTVVDNDAPMITCPPNISTQDNDPDKCGAVASFGSATATDNCGGVPVITYSKDSNTFFDVGTTTVTATANDGRGNTATCTFTVTIVDTQKPTFATCPANITVTPNGNSCNYTVKAGDALDPTGKDNCPGTLVFGHNYVGAPSPYTLVGASFPPSSTSTVTWTVTDAAGNTGTTSCTYTVTVGQCISISGMICWKNFGADPSAPLVGVGRTRVNLTGPNTALDTTTSVPNNGRYTLVVSGPGTYTVTPTKNINITNGLNSLDALRVQQHSTNALPITDPYMLIAADVNRNNVVNTADATLINQVVLGNPAAFMTFNKSWRFVPKSHSLSMPPWGFPEALTIPVTSLSLINKDFWGIKLGDLVMTGMNGAVDPAFLKPSAPPIAVVWTVQDQVLEAGQEVIAEFRVSNFENIGSYQFALHFDTEHLEVLDIVPTQALSLTKADNFGLFNVANGELRTVWTNPQGAYLTGGTRVFRVKFRALESGSLLSEVLRLDESVIEAEAAKTDLQVLPVELVFTQTSASKDVVGQSAQLRLMQNRPNPVVDRTSIGFELPQACEATLRIVDAMGRVITERTATYTAGYHEERFRLEEVGAQGVFYYELITPYGQLSNKMILMER